MSRPNILWIVTTQWRGQATGLAGDPNARTPALDRLARSGVNFTQAVTPHPFGPFARAALLTGVASPKNGVRDYFDPLPADARTVAHDLNDRGYATAFFGKWHLAPRDPAAALVGETHAKTIVPENRRGGFSFWEGFEGGFLLNDPWLHGTALPDPIQFLGYQSDVVTARAADWLKNFSRGQTVSNKPTQSNATNSNRPWFCVVSLEAPHPPYGAPVPPGITRTAAEKIILPANVPVGGEVEAKARRELAGYYSHVEATDRAIGRLADDVDDNTVLLVTSVHGDMHGAHGLFRKGWPYEESIRVPLVITDSSRENRIGANGCVSPELISLLDLRAVTVSWADETYSGVAQRLRPNAQQRPQPISMPSIVALPHQCDRSWRGIRTEKRKLIVNEDGSPWLFFDLEEDPLETRNLIGETCWAEEIEMWRRQISDSLR